MSQRLLVMCCLFLTAVSLGLAGMMWSQTVQARRMAEDQRRLAIVQEEKAREFQRQLMDQMKTSLISASKPSDWIPVVFEFRRGTPDGPPVAGVDANLQRANSRETQVRRISDAKGLVDLGFVQPGDWDVWMSVVIGRRQWSSREPFNTVPGGSIRRTIVCPDPIETVVPVSLSMEWPPDLANRDVGLVAGIRYGGYETQPGQLWRLLNPTSATEGADVAWLWSRPGKKDLVRLQARPVSWAIQPANFGLDPARPKSVHLDMLWAARPDPNATIERLPGRHEVLGLYIVGSLAKVSGDDRGLRGDLIGYAGPALGFDVNGGTGLWHTSPPGRLQEVYRRPQPAFAGQTTEQLQEAIAIDGSMSLDIGSSLDVREKLEDIPKT